MSINSRKSAPVTFYWNDSYRKDEKTTYEEVEVIDEGTDPHGNYIVEIQWLGGNKSIYGYQFVRFEKHGRIHRHKEGIDWN
jgi:hypothetical protein